MPVFKVDIIFKNGKHIKEYRIVEDVDLDTYYSAVFLSIESQLATVSGFDVVQLSEFSPVSKFMRSNNHTQMSKAAYKVQWGQHTGRRRRRF